MNPITDCPGFLCTIILFQPLLWFCMAFAVITSSYAVTKRDDIMRNGSGAIRIRDWYPMVKGEFVKKSGRTATYSTTAVKVVKSKLPIGFSEIVWQAPLSGFVPMPSRAQFPPVLFGVLFSSFSSILEIAFKVFRFPRPNFCNSVRVIAFYALFSFSLLINISGSPIPARLTALLAVFLRPFFVILTKLFRVACALGLFNRAAFTSGAQALLFAASLIKVFKSCREFVAADCAAFKGYVILVLHVEPPFDVPCPRLLAQRWDVLFTPLIIPQKRFVLWT